MVQPCTIDSAKETGRTKWYVDWQSQQHARIFDGRHLLSPRALVRNFESFHDVRLLRHRLDPRQSVNLLEIGCATGEFYRYLKITSPQVAYYGIDISRPALDMAKQKYPDAHFVLTDPAIAIAENLRGHGIPDRPEIVYSKDVLHHQTDPFTFLSQLLQIPSGALLLRTRTRDTGQTVTDPEYSCQYHYDGWMPYIVFNVEELIGAIQRDVPEAEIAVYRNHMILGGKENRFLPKECYLPQTGTAETAVGVFLKTASPHRVTVEDCEEPRFSLSFGHRVSQYLKRRFSGSA